MVSPEIIINYFYFLKFQAAYLQKWIFPNIMCKLIPFAAALSVSVSILTLVAISLDRYYIIVYPQKRKLKLKQCIFLLIGIWIVSILMSSCRLQYLSVEKFKNSVKEINRCEVIDFELYHFEIYFFAISQYFLPLLTITFIYSRISYYIYSQKSNSLIKRQLRNKNHFLNHFKKF